MNKSVCYALYLALVSFVINVGRTQAAEENAIATESSEVIKKDEEKKLEEKENDSRMFVAYSLGTGYSNISFNNNFGCEMPSFICDPLTSNINGKFEMSAFAPVHNFGLGFAKEHFRVMVNFSPGFTAEYEVKSDNPISRWAGTSDIRYSGYLISTDYLFLFENAGYINLGSVLGLTVLDTFGYTSNTIGLQFGYSYELGNLLLTANSRIIKLFGNNEGNLLPTFGINEDLKFTSMQILLGVGYIFN